MVDENIRKFILQSYYEGHKKLQIAKMIKEIYNIEMSDEGVRSIVRREIDRTKEKMENQCRNEKLDEFDVDFEEEDVESKNEVEKLKTFSQSYKNGVYEQDRLIELAEGETITPATILKAHNLDPNEWEVVSYTNNYWHSQVKGGKRLLMYQSKIFAKPVGIHLDHDYIKEQLSSFNPNANPIKYVERTDGRKLAVVNIADLHLGKLCWKGDTGNNFDSKIAKNVFKKLITEIYCELFNDESIEKIIFVWTNDFFNSDTIQKTTTALTPQDTDLRWSKLFLVGVELLTESTELLRSIAPVEMFYTRSNHDQMVSYYALMYLYAWFKDVDNVYIDINAFPRKYREYGNVLLGFAHGDKEGKESRSKESASRLSSLLCTEAREAWGRTKYHEMQTAHLHSEHTTEEINGVIVRRIASPTAIDTYHAENGYTSAVRKAQVFIYDKEDGLRSIMYFPVREEEEK